MDLKDLKAQMGKLGNVANELKEKESSTYAVDERLFKPTKDSAGNISCIIRFLPQSDFSKSPYVEKYGHFINATGKNFMCACTNEGKKDGDCPVCEKAKPYWKDYWAARDAHGKDHSDCKTALKGANKYGANKQTFTNILVVQNPLAPETEGKVFIYSMPKAAVDKYKQKLFPKDDMDEMVLIHHPWEGKNFKLDAHLNIVDDQNKFIEYKDSYFFDKTTPISPDENRVLQIMNETYDLDGYLAETKPDKEDIAKRFNEFKKFLGLKKEEVVEEEVNVDEIEELSVDDIFDLFED